jgi:hypothetical protein
MSDTTDDPLDEDELDFRRPQPSKIYDDLYISDYRAAVDLNNLKRIGITHILCVKESMSYSNHGDSIQRMHVSVSDTGTSQLQRDVFPKCSEFIEKAVKKGGKVLVHCSGGVNRSPTVVIGYLMKHRGMTMFEAYEHVVKCRPKALPHPEYLRQLTEYDESLHGVQSMPEDKWPKSLQEIFQELEAKSIKETAQSISDN